MIGKTVIAPESPKTAITNRSMKEEANMGNLTQIMEVILRLSRDGFEYKGKPHYLEKYHVRDSFLWSVMDEVWNRSSNRAMESKDYYLKYHPGDKEGSETEYNEAFSNNFLDEISELERRMYVMERRRNKEPTYQQVFNNATYRLTVSETEYLARLKNTDRLTVVELERKLRQCRTTAAVRLVHDGKRHFFCGGIRHNMCNHIGCAGILRYSFLCHLAQASYNTIAFCYTWSSFISSP